LATYLQGAPLQTGESTDASAVSGFSLHRRGLREVPKNRASRGEAP